MAGNDDPTKPLPVVGEPQPGGQPTEAMNAAAPAAPTEPFAAHVPVADAHTAEFDAAAAPPPAERSRSGRVLVGVLLGALALGALVFALAFLGPWLMDGDEPATSTTPSPRPTPAATTTSAPEDPDAPSGPAPAPEEPAPEPEPVEPPPAPEPSQPVEPTEPPVEPTPTPTP